MQSLIERQNVFTTVEFTLKTKIDVTKLLYIEADQGSTQSMCSG